jgi:thioredoxin reductase
MADKFRIAIVGSGPAGLSAAAHAAKIGVSHVLLEKTDHLSDTIYRYQKKKYVMAAPPQLVLRADVNFEAGYRETILDVWNKGVAEAGANVRYNAEVKAVSGQKGDFTLTLTNGDTVQAETIVMAIGLQGNPNLMRCPGGDLPHVQYQLDDPTAYIDEHIFIIGAGDAGIENALGLAADPAQANVVSIVNRSADFSRAKDANVATSPRPRPRRSRRVGSPWRSPTGKRACAATASSPDWAPRRPGNSSNPSASSSPAPRRTPTPSLPPIWRRRRRASM